MCVSVWLSQRGAQGCNACYSWHNRHQSASAVFPDYPSSLSHCPWLSILLSLALPLLAFASGSNGGLRSVSLFLGPFDVSHLSHALNWPSCDSERLDSRAPRALRERVPLSARIVWAPGERAGIEALDSFVHSPGFLG